MKVVFVCLGNICRSPMAEAVFRDMVFKAGASGEIDEISVDSCGTSGWHIGEPPHRKTMETLRKYGVSYEGIYAEKLNASHFDADYIIAMDKENLSDIIAEKPACSKAEIKLLSEYGKGGWVSVPDPWYTGDFEETYALICEAAKGLLESLTQQ